MSAADLLGNLLACSLRLGALVAAGALVARAFLVREPRTGKLYEFKQVAIG